MWHLFIIVNDMHTKTKRRLYNDELTEDYVSFQAVHLMSKEESQNAPTLITTYALFYDGEYLTNEQMNDKRFLKVISKQA